MSVEAPVRDSQIAYFDVNLTPSIDTSSAVSIAVSSLVPDSATALVVPVAAGGAPPSELGLTAAALKAAGFEGTARQTLVVPRTDGPTLVAVGIGDSAQVNAA